MDVFKKMIKPKQGLKVMIIVICSSLGDGSVVPGMQYLERTSKMADKVSVLTYVMHTHKSLSHTFYPCVAFYIYFTLR